MDLHAQFDQRVLLHGADLPWVDSPVAGVQRRMLDRIGGEVARATTIVRYAPGSHFSPHTHQGGEEFLVLDGVFQDEHGNYPAGSYIRNPPTSRHTPGSEIGCVIFVKLWQFDLADRSAVVIDTNKIGRVDDATRPGVAVTPLFEDERETVSLETWQPGTRLDAVMPDGAELLVLVGGFAEGADELRAWSWLRVPRGGRLAAVTGAQGATVWIKTRHLRLVQAPPSA
jgi:hypothetical protein